MPTAFWALYYLIRDDEARAAVLNELETSGVMDSEGFISVDAQDIESVKTLDSVLVESMRLTTGSIIMRQVTTETPYALQVDDKVCGDV